MRTAKRSRVCKLCTSGEMHKVHKKLWHYVHLQVVSKEVRKKFWWCATWKHWKTALFLAVAESEITILKPRSPAPTIVCSMYCQLWEPGNKTTHSVLNVNQNPACLWSRLKSDFQVYFLAALACLSYVAATCTKLRAICDHYLTESTCSNYWSSICKNCITHEIWGLKWLQKWSPSI